ncbi:MAG: elongation factor P 5-aminopentanone reductase [Candidatus Merdivicinus sp.]|jgi:3-oxoacyl-[acyl-carrier protein] reductase
MEKIALITGASRGIGRETALKFWREGCRVVLNYNQSAQEAILLAEELNRLRPNSAISLQADVSCRDSVMTMRKKIESLWGDVDILVNNAGIAQQKLFTDITDSDWDRMFSVDVKGVFLCCQAFLPAMIRRKSGKIINIASMWGQVGASCEVHYSAAKGAVIALTKALAQEVGPSHIQVNCVSPGLIATEMNGHLSSETIQTLLEEIPLGVVGQPADIAEAVWFLASPQSDFITGQVLAPNGGMVL